MVSWPISSTCALSATAAHWRPAVRPPTTAPTPRRISLWRHAPQALLLQHARSPMSPLASRYRGASAAAQRRQRVAPSGALEQLGDGREGALPGHVRGAGVVLVAQAAAGAGAHQALHQRRIAVAAGDDQGGVTELVLRVLLGVPGEQLLDDLNGAGVHR